ncbi:TetR/AcrR family transcriptional regulator [Pseudolysinimonas sp.]|uniref:TetR/AcrR family transcriptional regulator n=1 Tax=Pseudolysinimonas sp. TaxID=2680009 RepID=UPI003F7F6C0B
MEPNDPAARRGPYRKGLAQRARLVAAAMSAFERRGCDLTLADVAEAAGVSREAVRHYFATVSDLLLALQGEYDARNARLSADDEPLPERVAAAVRSAYAARGSAALTALLTARAVIDGESSVGRAMRERSARLRTSLAAAVQAAQDAGEFRDDIAAPVLARLLLAAAQGLATQELVEGERAAEGDLHEEALIRLFAPSGGRRAG